MLLTGEYDIDYSFFFFFGLFRLLSSIFAADVVFVSTLIPFIYELFATRTEFKMSSTHLFCAVVH